MIESKVKLLSHTLNPELVIACAGKLCYSKVGVDELLEKQTEETIDKFITMLADLGHESPIEHASFTFAIEGVSRSLTHQLVRHRIASYSQQSQRYVNFEDNIKYVTPNRYKDNEHLKSKYEEVMMNAFEAYLELTMLSMKHEFKKLGYDESFAKDSREGKNYPNLLEYVKAVDKKTYTKIEKECIEDARYVLPNAAETKIVVTMNARSLINFIKHRSCDRAQWEIRELAEKMIIEVKKVSPILFKNLGPSCVTGPCPEGKMCCGKVKEKREKYLNR